MTWLNTMPVYTGWDLGWDDKTVIWFAQIRNNQMYIIDYYENNHQPMEHYVKAVMEKPYVYAKHYFPHDGASTEFGSGLTRQATATKLGLRNIEILQRGSIPDRIQAVRATFTRIHIDKTKCATGLNALANYTKDYDEKLKKFKDHPRHDWASHASDSFGYLCQGLKGGLEGNTLRPQLANTAYNPWRMLEENPQRTKSGLHNFF